MESELHFEMKGPGRLLRPRRPHQDAAGLAIGGLGR
jgi:hypothetical protein